MMRERYMEKRKPLIITYFDPFKKYAIEEVKRVDGQLIETQLSPSISLIEPDTDTDEFIRCLVDSDPIFTRHVHPVDVQFSLSGLTVEQGKQVVLERIAEVCIIPAGEPFSVQCRIESGEHRFNSKDIEVLVGTYYEKQGAVPEFSDYEITDKNVYIISILIEHENVYTGLSKASENLNSHSNEHRILSRKGREISRAENKLKEAINKFRPELSGQGLVLDIGASPGGWTKVLADYGYTVIAVDPGMLHESLYGLPNVTHYREKIENLEFEDTFGLIVCDMNVEPQVSARMMCGLSDRLIDSGNVIVTLKMPFRNIRRSLDESVEILNTRYEIVSIKSLFHNRRELTAFLEKK